MLFMKLIDKLKNALFEEEYVEVEEKPQKKAVRKEVKPKTNKIHEEQPEKPIAKKIVLPEKREVKITTHEEEVVEEENEISNFIEEQPVNDFNFPLVSDNEFNISYEPRRTPPVETVQVEKPPREEKRPEKKEVAQEKKSKPYGIDDMKFKEPEYGTYEKKEEKNYFKPSPIISPIYGILDKNYKQEDVVQKREVRITSSYSREKMDLDEVRKKAYGGLGADLEDVHNDSQEDMPKYPEEVESNFADNDLLDLTNDDVTPEVKKVTMGDAEEYFEDLGLEYNVDYKDVSKEKATGRRYHGEEDDDFHDDEPKFITEEKSYEYQQQDVKQEGRNDDIDDDNLFDLIDSMYDKE